MILRKGQDPDVAHNFEEVKRTLQEACPVVRGVLTEEVTLLNGPNKIRVPSQISRPQGRITVFVSANVSLTDAGLDPDGNWTIVSTGGARARFIFF